MRKRLFGRDPAGRAVEEIVIESADAGVAILSYGCLVRDWRIDGPRGSLSMVLELPVPPRMLDRLLANNPILRESLAKQRIRVPVGGTLARPRLDTRALDDAVAGVMRGAAKSATENLIEKGRDRLLDELMKRRQPPKK